MLYNLYTNYLKGNTSTKKDYQEAFKFFKNSAEGGYPSGIMMLGYCYDTGIGINIDKQKAVELYQKAANLGHKLAQYNLGGSYEVGDGIEKNIDKAIYWYEQSANQGDKDAQKILRRLKNS